MDPVEWANEVSLVGRVTSEPEEVVMPSGDRLVKLRVSVPRPEERKTRQAVDVFDCAAWSARSRRSVASWNVGDVVQIEGAVRRRFYRAAGGALSSRVEVEVQRTRRLRKAPAA